MNYSRARIVCSFLFALSVIGWTVFGLIIRPDELFGAEESVPPPEPHLNLWQVLLILIGLLAPVFSAVGWLAITILRLQSANGVRQGIEWIIE